jgi:putative membrane protein
MNRRLTLAGLGSTLAMVGSTRHAYAQAATGQLTQTQAMALGGMAFALETSRIARSRAANALVRNFAELETEEQQAFAAARARAGLPAPNPQMMDAQKQQKKQQMVQQLSGQSGAGFDRMYIQGQIMGHQELQQLHAALAQSAPTREERMLGTVAVPAIRSHLAMLAGIQQQLGG